MYTQDGFVLPKLMCNPRRKTHLLGWVVGVEARETAPAPRGSGSTNLESQKQATRRKNLAFRGSANVFVSRHHEWRAQVLAQLAFPQASKAEVLPRPRNPSSFITWRTGSWLTSGERGFLQNLRFLKLKKRKCFHAYEPLGPSSRGGLARARVKAGCV